MSYRSSFSDVLSILPFQSPSDPEGLKLNKNGILKMLSNRGALIISGFFSRFSLLTDAPGDMTSVGQNRFFLHG